MKHSLIPLLLATLLLPALASAGPVDINNADAKTLARELQRIGLARAQAIVDYRAKNGPFKSADDLARVKGIGQRVIEENRANIRLDKGGEKAAAPAAGKGQRD